jgi:hypothetical protein
MSSLPGAVSWEAVIVSTDGFKRLIKISAFWHGSGRPHVTVLD